TKVGRKRGEKNTHEAECLRKIQRLRPDDTPYSSGCCHLMKCEYFAGQSSPWDAFLEMERG
ncbi:hypothetical protein, partial [Phocaeicola vulgatus]|uniref:hypothetical protein n=1 Tax=Phocaeicola vulgatus TaxID=821 RepID=UPI0032C0FAEA